MQWKLALASLMVIVFAGCMGGDAEPAQPAVSRTAEQTAVAKQVAAIGDAEKAGLGTFAPVTLPEAKEAAFDAQALLKEGESPAEVSQKLSQSKQWFEKAKTSRAIAEKELAEILTYKEKLTALKAGSLYPDEFESFTEGLNEIIYKIDSGEGVSSFDSRASVQAEGRELYSKAVIQGSLYKVADILEEMEEHDLVAYAPKAYAKAQDTYKNSTFTIQQFPDNEEVIAKASVAALEDAQVALLIAKESRKVSESDERSVEFYVEQIHGKLSDIYGKLDANGSIMTRPLPQKLGQIEVKVGAVQEKIAGLQKENTQQKETLAQMQSQVASLQSSLKNVESKGGDLQKQYSAAALELSKLTKENQQLQQDLNRSRNDLSSAQSLLVSVQGDSQKNKGEAATLRQKTQTLAREVDTLKQQVASREATIKSLTQERDALKAKVSEAAAAPAAPAEAAPVTAPAAQ